MDNLKLHALIAENIRGRALVALIFVFKILVEKNNLITVEKKIYVFQS